MRQHSAGLEDGNLGLMPAAGICAGSASAIRSVGRHWLNSLEFQSMTTSEPSVDSSQGELTLSLDHHHASHSRLLDEEKERLMTATSGRQCWSLSSRSSRVGSALKMLLESTEWFSKASALIWRAQVTKSGNRLSFQLVPLERATGGTDFGLLPTLIARDYKHPGNIERQRKRRRVSLFSQSLPVFVGLKLTAKFCERYMGYPENHTELNESKHSATPSSRKSHT